MWILLLILAAIALWYSPSLRRSVAQLIDPDEQPVREFQRRTVVERRDDPASEASSSSPETKHE